MAELVAKDARLNLALLRIAGPIPAFIELKSANLPALGEGLVAIGRTPPEPPSSLSFAEGIASAVGDATTNNWPYIRSTVQLLPGMEGGPLVSQKTGEVVGVNSGNFTHKETGALVSFAVPVQVFLRAQQELLTKGRVSRYIIGIGTAPVTDDIRTAIGLTGKDGVLIVSVRDGGPAARAGLLAGDIVVSVNSTTVPNAASLFELINAHGPLPNLRVIVFRRGSLTSVEVHPEELLEK